MRRVYWTVWAVALLVLFSTPVAYGVPYRGYTYDFWENAIDAPQAYIPNFVMDGSQLGIGAFRNPQDLFVSDAGELYIADSGNNRIVVLDQDWSVVRIIDSFTNNGEEDAFLNPKGVFVTDENHIFVADTNNRRIVELNPNFEVVREVGPPTSSVKGVIPEGFDFQPYKVVVDHANRIYVIVENVYDGILEFGVDGEFRGFIGAPRIAPNMIDYFWRKIATDAQRESLIRFLPTEYSNIALDQYGFIYATVTDGDVQEKEFVRRLNPTGTDVLRRTGFHPPVGDIIYPESWEDVSFLGPSVLTDVVAQQHGVYSVLDRRRGRVFTYDADGSLLFTFGGRGDQRGLFRNAVAIEIVDGQMVILDSLAGSFTVFRPTEYSEAILAAIEHHNTGRYDESADTWAKVASLNSNYELAYSGIGSSLLRQNKFKEAMDAFQLGNNRLDYSEALGLYRREILAKHFGTIVFGIIALIAASKLYSTIKARKAVGYAEVAITAVPDYSTERNKFVAILKQITSGLRYSLYLILHPFDGFWDLKHEKRGNVYAATVILALVSLTYVFMRQYTGFVFNARNLQELNIIMEFASVLVPFGLWCSVNWALTTLMEGKGTLRDVYIASAYALTPLVLINIPMTFISNFLTVQEGAFYYFFIVLGVLWAGGLLFFGTMITHDYDMKKTFYTSVLVVIGIIIVLFLGLLFFTLIDKMRGFVNDIYTEIVFRL